MSKQNQPHKSHDEFVKNSLLDKTIAQDLMRHVLPTALLKNLDISCLELGKNSYITCLFVEKISNLALKK